MFLVEHCKEIRCSYIIASTRRYFYTMFKRLSLFTVILSGVLLAGCSNQQATSTKSSTRSEQTQKSTKKSTPEKSEKSDQSSSSSSNNSEGTTNNSNNDSNSNSNSSSNNNTGTTNNGSDTTKTDQNTTANNSNGTDNTNNQSTQNQDSTQTQQGVNIATADQAVSFLSDKLSATYDKTSTQYVANGKVTWNNVNGYQINIYSKNSDSPVGSYLVPANGQYFQIW